MNPHRLLCTLLALSLLYLASCSTTAPVVEAPEINLVVKPGVAIPTGASITVIDKLIGPDVTGAGGLITSRLMMHGFQVISGAAAREAVRTSEQISYPDSTVTEVRSEVYGVMELSSQYVLEFGGRYYLDWVRLPRHYDFTSFTASLIDLDTGEVVASASFVGNRPVEEVCTEFVDRLVDMIKE